MSWNKKTVVTSLFVGVIVIGAIALISGILLTQVPVIITGMALIGIGAFSTFMSSMRSRDN